MAAALDHAEAVLADVGVLRSEGDESLLGESHGVAMVVLVVDLGIRNVRRTPFEAVLADDDGRRSPGWMFFGTSRMP